jgi:hypothetical protein
VPFRDPDAGNLSTRIVAELRQRIEDALDAACLDTLVRTREARGLPLPAADSPRDREEYRDTVRQLLERLEAHFVTSLEAELLAKLERARREVADPEARAVAVQVALARELPDYWQRFDAVRLRYAEECAASGGQSRGLLRRLFARG